MFHHIDINLKKENGLKNIIKRIGKLLEWGIFTLIIVSFFIVVSPLLPTKHFLSTYIVSSGSMEPAVKTGSVSLVKPLNPKDIKTNQIIAFTSPADPNKTILHRVIEINDKGLFTKGDNNNAPDIWTVPLSSVKGEMVSAVPYLGHVAALMKTKLGFALILGIPALILLFLQFKQIINGAEEEITKRTKKALLAMQSSEGKVITMFLIGLLSGFTFIYGTNNLIQAIFTSQILINGMSFSVKDFVPPPAPSLISPLNDTYVNTSGLVMKWNGVSDYLNMHNPVYYIYQSARNSSFSPSAYLSGHLTQPQIPAPGTPDGQYWWRVKACDTLDNCSSWSTVWHTTVDSTPPSNFSLLSAGGHTPVNSNGDIYTNAPAPFMDWSDSTDTNFDHYEYVVYTTDVDTQTERDTPNCPIWGCGYLGQNLNPPTNPLTVSQYQAGNTPDGTYYWRVYAFDKAGNKTLSNKASGTNYTWKVVLDKVKPQSTISSPTDNAGISGEPIVISGQSTDNKGVGSVELLYSNYNGVVCNSTYAHIATLTNSANNSPYNWSYSWTPGTGTYCIKAEATDNAGNTENSPVVRNVRFDPDQPSSVLNLSGDKKSVGFTGSHIFKFDTLNYEITYDSDLGPKGISGTITIGGQNTITRTDLTLGSCTTEQQTCTYDTGITKITLKTTLIKSGLTDTVLSDQINY